MRNKVRSTEQKETGRDFRDIESRVSDLETKEYLTKAAADTLYATIPTNGTWTPAITGSVSNPTVTFTSNTAKYTIVNGMCFFNFRSVINTISGGSGQIRVSLPVASASGTINVARSIAVLSGTNVDATAYSLNFRVEQGVAYGTLQTPLDDGAIADVLIADLGNGDAISVTGFYWI